MNEIEEMLELIKEIDIQEMDMLDQMLIGVAYAEMASKVKPIYLKYMAKRETGTSFLFKL